MIESDETERLISIIKNLRKAIAEGRQNNKRLLLNGYKEVLQSYLQAKIALESAGFGLPEIQISGLTRAEVLQQIFNADVALTEHLNKLAKYKDSLVAEEVYLEVMGELNSQESNAINSNIDLISLNTDQKELVHQKLDDLRKAIRKAKWSSDDHKQRVLEKTNDLQRELDREISSYSRNLGKFVELGDAIGEFATGAKPASDLVKDVMDSFRLFKKENAQIEKQPDPLKIEDLRDEVEE